MAAVATYAGVVFKLIDCAPSSSPRPAPRTAPYGRRRQHWSLRADYRLLVL